MFWPFLLKLSLLHFNFVHFILQLIINFNTIHITIQSQIHNTQYKCLEQWKWIEPKHKKILPIIFELTHTRKIPLLATKPKKSVQWFLFRLPLCCCFYSFLFAGIPYLFSSKDFFNSKNGKSTADKTKFWCFCTVRGLARIWIEYFPLSHSLWMKTDRQTDKGREKEKEKNTISSMVYDFYCLQSIRAHGCCNTMCFVIASLSLSLILFCFVMLCYCLLAVVGGARMSVCLFACVWSTCLPCWLASAGWFPWLTLQKIAHSFARILLRILLCIYIYFTITLAHLTFGPYRMIINRHLALFLHITMHKYSEQQMFDHSFASTYHTQVFSSTEWSNGNQRTLLI